MRQKNHKLHTYFLHIIYFLHISHVESFFHMTICHVEHFSTWQSVMWRNFSTWQKNSPQAPPVMPVTNIRYGEEEEEGGEHLNWTEKLLMSKIHFTTWKDALLPARSSLNELREIWNLLPLKVKFGQISKSICDQPDLQYFERDFHKKIYNK